jgi:heme A synthase
MLERSSIVNTFYWEFFHRAAAAFFAMAVRSLAVSFLARAFPPSNPPSRPSATAAAFFFAFATPH